MRGGEKGHTCRRVLSRVATLCPCLILHFLTSPIIPYSPRILIDLRLVHLRGQDDVVDGDAFMMLQTPALWRL